MKKSYFLLLLLSAMLTTKAQQQPTVTKGSAPFHSKVNFTNSNIKDYDPQYINISQSPLPSAEYGNKKSILNHQRNEFKKKTINDRSAREASNILAPALLKGFSGNLGNSVPLDNDIAISNGGYILSVVNSNIRCYDDTGKLIFNKSLSTLDSVINQFTWISDPRVIYDHVADRFILVCFSGALSTNSHIIVGFSSTNNPSNDWNFYLLDGASFNDSTWSDYPIISVSNHDLFITFNQVKDNVSWQVGFKQSVIWQIDKQRGYNADTLHYQLWSNLNLNGKNYRNICPAKYQDNTLPDDMYFLSVRNVDFSNDSVFLLHITNSYQSGLAQLTAQTLVSNHPYGFPPNPKQKNGQYLMTNDGRVLCAIKYQDKIYFGSNSVNTTYMNAGVYLGMIDQVSTAPVATGQVYSSATIEYAYPSMAVVGNLGSEGIIYNMNHCVSDSFAGVTMVCQDMNGAFSDFVRIKNGTSSVNILTDSTERWGDYSDVQRRFNDPCKSYSASTFMLNSGYRTWIQTADACAINAGVQRIVTDYQSTIFPNPATDRFTLAFELDEKTNIVFYLCSIDGSYNRILLQQTCKTGKNYFSISTEALSAGTYILQARSNTGQVLFSNKIVKMK